MDVFGFKVGDGVGVVVLLLVVLSVLVCVCEWMGVIMSASHCQCLGVLGVLCAS